VGAKNTGEGKQYGEIYRSFLHAVQLPKSYVNSMYSSRYARHFYTPEEIDAFRTRHMRRIVQHAQGWDDSRAKQLVAAEMVA
jgi:hypothetical protein